MEFNLGLASPFLFPSDLGDSLHCRSPFHVGYIVYVDTKLTSIDQNHLDGSLRKVESKTRIPSWHE
jgi:hypothetical protein